jgi:hypothetical protein
MTRCECVGGVGNRRPELLELGQQVIKADDVRSESGLNEGVGWTISSPRSPTSKLSPILQSIPSFISLSTGATTHRDIARRIIKSEIVV